MIWLGLATVWGKKLVIWLHGVRIRDLVGWLMDGIGIVHISRYPGRVAFADSCIQFISFVSGLLRSIPASENQRYTA